MPRLSFDAIKRRLGNDIMVRAASALILIPAALALVAIGGLLLRIAIFGVGLRLFYEWNRLTMGRGRSKTLIAQAVVLAGAMIAESLGDSEFALVLLIAGALLIAASIALPRPRKLWGAIGLIYVGLPALSLLWLDGPELIFWLLATVWATDIGAYLSGRLLGGPKLWPAVSPNKTWAGLAGGLTFAVLVSAIFGVYLDNISAAFLSFLGGIVALSAQAGDLFESALKRRYGVKDSGRLIPGHGGALDRLDGLIVSAPIAALILGIATP